MLCMRWLCFHSVYLVSKGDGVLYFSQSKNYMSIFPSWGTLSLPHGVLTCLLFCNFINTFFFWFVDLMEVIAWLLHPKPESRATVYDMERDPWVWQRIHISEYDWQQVLPNSGNNHPRSYLHRSKVVPTSPPPPLITVIEKSTSILRSRIPSNYLLSNRLWGSKLKYPGLVIIKKRDQNKKSASVPRVNYVNPPLQEKYSNVIALVTWHVFSIGGRVPW